MLKNKIIECIRWLNRKIRYVLIKEKTISIVSNNCIGADISRMCNLGFYSPTVNLQILPTEFVRFCKNIEYYLSVEVIEYRNISALHRKMIFQHYGKYPEEIEFPFALCDDIVICCQHYKTFEDFASCWNRRKLRVNTDRFKKIFVIDESNSREATEFVQIMNPQDVLFTLNFDMVNGTRIDTPMGIHFMDYQTPFKKYYQQRFNILKWINSK